MSTLAAEETQEIMFSESESENDSYSEVVALEVRLKDPKYFTPGAWKKKQEHEFSGIDKDGNVIPMECGNGMKWGAAGLKKCPKFRASVKGGDSSSSKKGKISSNRKAQDYYNNLSEEEKARVKNKFNRKGGTGSHGTITKKDMKDYLEGKKKKKKNGEKDFFNKGALELIGESDFDKKQFVEIMNLQKGDDWLFPRRELKKSHYGEPEVTQAILCLEVIEALEALKSKQ
tara:strand:+ start:183 stop:872 length:690 start_codon:yes stop_codon:yes gene_type:complete